VDIDRDARHATITVSAPTSDQPKDLAGIVAAGAQWWPLKMARELDDAILTLRANHLDIGMWVLKTHGDAAQVLVCSGSQQALDLIARLLLDPGDEVLVEDPGYPGIRASLLGHGALARPVPLDESGLCIAQGAAQWPAARMAVVTPTHQFPTGVRMDLPRRQALLQWAREHDAWVVEDDYDGEFQ
ncbi:aminotransferase class I/II-fold pyridoxal phosphate-dependent enzyme, partial [Sphingomonas adhaesiva]|uniref:aminotransferase class I/II-fold pyridoxal phosphate-dependent enzyme n=1 Tax=Sphingomonas adhaesiva TaxID=28212 RepID=UPI0035C695F4